MKPKTKIQPVPDELKGSADERVDAIEETLSDPKKLAAVLEAASADSKSLDRLFSKIFCDLIEKDENVQKAVQKHVTAVDRNTLKRFSGKIGFAIWSVFLILITILLTKWIGK